MNWKLVRYKEENGFIRGHLYLDCQWVSDTYEHGTLADVNKHRMLMAVHARSIATQTPAFLSGGKWRYILPFELCKRGDILPISRTFNGNELNTEANQHLYEDIKQTCKRAWRDNEPMFLTITTREGMGPGKKK